jgi:CTP synthase (UTP-ammonia lyase)
MLYRIGLKRCPKFPWMRRERSLTFASSRWVNLKSLELIYVNFFQLGGTVGDIESAPFVEAMRQFQFRVGHANFALIHVSLVLDMHGEQKTKPTQSTVSGLRGLGLLPDLVSCSNP